MGQLTTEAGVLVLRQLVLVGQFWRRTAHEDGVAVFVHPRGIARVVESLFQIGRQLHDTTGLTRPPFGTYFLDDPPVFERLDGVARTVDHAHVLIKIGDVEVGLIVVHLTSADEESARRIDAEELVATDSYRLKAHLLTAHQMAVLRKRQVTAKECCIDMAVQGRQLRVTAEHGVQGWHVIDGTLEG